MAETSKGELDLVLPNMDDYAGAPDDIRELEALPEWQAISPEMKELIYQRARGGEPVPDGWLQPGESVSVGGGQSAWDKNKAKNVANVKRELGILGEGAGKAWDILQEPSTEDPGKFQWLIDNVPGAQAIWNAVQSGEKITEAAQPIVDSLMRLAPKGESQALASQPPDEAPEAPERDAHLKAQKDAADIRSRNMSASASYRATPRVSADLSGLGDIETDMMTERKRIEQEGGKHLDTIEGAQKYQDELWGEQQELVAQRADQETARAVAERNRLEAINQGQQNLKKRFDEELAIKQNDYETWKEEHGELDMSDAIIQKSPLGIAAAILSGFGTALGAWGATIGKTKNFAAETAQNGLKARLAAMKETIRSSEAKGRSIKNEYTELKDYFGDEMAADLAFQLRDMDALLATYDTQIARIKNKEDQISAAGQREGLVMEREKLAMDLEQQLSGHVMEGLKSQAAVEKAQISAQMDLDKTNAAFALKAAAGSRVKAGKQLPAGEASKLGESQTAIDSLRRLQQQFRELGPEAALSQFVPGTEGRDYKKMRLIVSQKLARAIHGARASDRDVAKIEESLPTSWSWDSTAVGQFDSWMQEATASHNNRLQAFQSAGWDVSGFDLAEAGGEDPILGNLPTREAF